MKKINLASILTLLTLSVFLVGCGEKAEIEKEKPGNQPGQTQLTEDEKDFIDTSDWQTYRNEELGFEVKYPEDWEVEESQVEVSFYSKQVRDGLPEGGGGVIIKKTNNNLTEFISNYESSDPPHSKIKTKEDYRLNNLDTIKLTANTAIGIDSNILFISDGSESNYLVYFHDFDQDHLKILNSFNLID